MSLYQHNFTLLPIASRTIFSHGNEASRLKLPDFATVAELQDFTTRLLILEGTIPGYWAMAVVGASIVCLLVIVTALIIMRRMYDQSFWLLRVKRRPTGIVIVPNTLVAFTLCEGAFGVIFVAFCWMHRAWFDRHTLLPHNYFVWILLMWYPLACGPLVAVYGTYFAIPSSLLVAQVSPEEASKDETARRPSWLRRLASHSVVLNVTAIVLPLLIFASILAPTLIANAHQTRALQRMLAWVAEYEGQTAFTERMIQDAQLVWFDSNRAFNVAAAVFLMWFLYSFILATAYAWVTLRLLSAVGAELRKDYKAGEQHTMVVTQFVVSEGLDMSALSRQEDDDVHRAIELELWKTRNAQQPTWKHSQFSGAVSKDSQMSGLESMFTPASTMTGTGHVSHRAERLTSPKRFAALRKLIPNIIAKTAAHPHLSNAPSSHDHQMRELRKAYRHHLIQAVAIAPGCIIFSAIALWGSIVLCGASEHPRVGGGMMVDVVVSQLMLTIIWVVVVLGSITLVAIAQRTYEPVLNSRKWATAGVKAARNERGGKEPLEQVPQLFLPSASQALASRLGEGITSFGPTATRPDTPQA